MSKSRRRGNKNTTSGNILAYVLWVMGCHAGGKCLEESGVSIPLIISLCAVAALIPLLLRILKRRIRYMRYINSPLAKVDRMDGHEFERYLAALFIMQGYRVENVGESGSDFGGDLILTKRFGCRLLVQAKRYSGSVGVKAVQEALAAKAYYNCTGCMVVTTNYFTSPAKEMAQKCSVTLCDRNWIKRYAK